jgi:hypothetical protein
MATTAELVSARFLSLPLFFVILTCLNLTLLNLTLLMPSVDCPPSLLLLSSTSERGFGAIVSIPRASSNGL